MKFDLHSIFNYSFNDTGLLRQAFTHPSYLNESRDRVGADYQRLEFLGDAVLDLCLAEMLFNRYPDIPEGDLSRLRASLVDQPRLGELAKENGIGTYILLGRGEERGGGREKPSILSDVLEALFGAIFLDGGFDAVKLVIGQIYSGLLDMPIEGDSLGDPKSELQEWAAASDLPPPLYELISEDGPPHDRSFTVSVSLGGGSLAAGEGRSKKLAQQDAARRALQILKEAKP